MNRDQLLQYIETFFNSRFELLKTKNASYSPEGDALSAFKQAAAFTPGETPEQALWGMAKKHLISVTNIIADHSTLHITDAQSDEKIGDLINYLFLLRALLQDRSDEASLALAVNQKRWIQLHDGFRAPRAESTTPQSTNKE